MTCSSMVSLSCCQCTWSWSWNVHLPNLIFPFFLTHKKRQGKEYERYIYINTKQLMLNYNSHKLGIKTLQEILVNFGSGTLFF